MNNPSLSTAHTVSSISSHKSSRKSSRSVSNSATNVLRKEIQTYTAEIAGTTIISEQQLYLASSIHTQNGTQNTRNTIRPWPFPTGIRVE